MGDHGHEPLRRAGYFPFRHGADGRCVEGRGRRAHEAHPGQAHHESLHGSLDRRLRDGRHPVVIRDDSAGCRLHHGRTDVARAVHRRNHGCQHRHDDHGADRGLQGDQGRTAHDCRRFRDAVLRQAGTLQAVWRNAHGPWHGLLRNGRDERRYEAAAFLSSFPRSDGAHGESPGGYSHCRSVHRSRAIVLGDHGHRYRHGEPGLHHAAGGHSPGLRCQYRDLRDGAAGVHWQAARGDSSRRGAHPVQCRRRAGVAWFHRPAGGIRDRHLSGRARARGHGAAGGGDAAPDRQRAHDLQRRQHPGVPRVRAPAGTPGGPTRPRAPGGGTHTPQVPR